MLKDTFYELYINKYNRVNEDIQSLVDQILFLSLYLKFLSHINDRQLYSETF